MLFFQDNKIYTSNHNLRVLDFFTAVPSSLADFLAMNENNITGTIPSSSLSSIYDLTTTPSFSVRLKLDTTSNLSQMGMACPFDALLSFPYAQILGG